MKEAFTEQLFSMRIPELIAVITGIVSVWFAKKENILVYPVGIISVLLYVYICFQVKLYADAAVNFYYFAASIYGWYYWMRGKKYQHTKENNKLLDQNLDAPIIKEENEKAEITYNTLNENIIYIASVIAIGFSLAYILKTYTDSNVYWADGFTTALFIVAMYAMAKKKIENWILWIIGDAACIPLFIYKGLYVSSFQYLIFTIIAIAGYLAWYKKLQKKFIPAS